MKVPRALIEYILLGGGDSRRHLQDSPILGDVWFAFAEQPFLPCELLITSHKDTTAAKLAAAIYHRVHDRPDLGLDDPAVAPLQSFVAARFTFDQVLKILVPMTKWWHEYQTQLELLQYLKQENEDDADGSAQLAKTVGDVIDLLRIWSENSDEPTETGHRTAFQRFVALCALVIWARQNTPPEVQAQLATGSATTPEIEGLKEQTLTKMQVVTDDEVRGLVFDLLRDMTLSTVPMIWQISLNRPAAAAVVESVPTVKGDAARRVFGIDCTDVHWAVVDSGVDQTHPAFNPTRIVEAYDFTQYRRIVALGNAVADVRAANLGAIGAHSTLPDGADATLESIAQNAVQGLPVRWDLVKDFVLLKDPPPPASEHGTHVAGIIGASKQADDESTGDGMCPGIGLYDFRILGPDAASTEFAIIAALQFIRFTNEQAGFLQINGVNMSLSIKHDVRNYACGNTPVCVESERLIESGVVVVAAAGNLGYQQTVIDGRSQENYLAFSITDPGNADRVITVGATHRNSPNTYGVSYFSSRGPTGDGRLKPDLVAPGERIYSTVPDGGWDFLDGTSMAAPYVSGAAAMLMARYPELIGKPDRIKQILCDSATDLGRERNFQGHGLLDVLGALQSQ